MTAQSKRILPFCLLFAAIAMLSFIPSIVDSSPKTSCLQQDGARAMATQSRYDCIPKGVTLEGTAEGIPEVKQVSYDRKGNQFILNGSVLYDSPLSRTQMIQIIRALLKDDRLGVSFNITNDSTAVFGALRSTGDVTDALVKTDTLLAAVIFGWDKYLDGVELPGGYVPEKVTPGSKTVGYFVFDKYQFAVNENKLSRIAMTMTPNVFPVLSTTGKNAGFQLDEEALKRDDYLTPAHQTNLREIYANMDGYRALTPVAQTIQAGEAAAFIRFLKESGIELKPLLKQM